MTDFAKSFRDLNVYKDALSVSMGIFNLTKSFPSEEKYSLTDQIRRASRSVCANIGEAWRKRRYVAAFVAKLSDSETEACEVQVWLDFSLLCNYISKEKYDELNDRCEKIIAQIIRMIETKDKWIVKASE